MKKLIILYCISAWVGLGACSVYKSYERPDMPVVDSLYRQAAATSADTQRSTVTSIRFALVAGALHGSPNCRP